MARLNKLLTGYTITDELFQRTSSTALKLAHDTIRGTADLEIWTGAGKTGTKLTITTDYTVSEEDTVLSAEVGGGISVYKKVAIVNGAYHSTNLYANYKTIGDYASVESVSAASGAVGDIKMIAYASPDDGWLLCNGQAVSRATYSALFAKIGLVWGIGDGSTTFNVPDLRESCPVGAGTYSAVAGTTHGAMAAHDARSLGAFADDQSQGHIHTPLLYTGNAGSSGAVWHFDVAASSKSLESIGSTGVPQNDGTNGAPRLGAVTRGKTIGVNFVIKY